MENRLPTDQAVILICVRTKNGEEFSITEKFQIQLTAVSNSNPAIVTIGRSDDCKLKIMHDSVSQLHCELHFTLSNFLRETFVVIDKSRNGILINGVRRAEKNVETEVSFDDEVMVTKKPNVEQAGSSSICVVASRVSQMNKHAFNETVDDIITNEMSSVISTDSSLDTNETPNQETTAAVAVNESTNGANEVRITEEVLDDMPNGNDLLGETNGRRGNSVSSSAPKRHSSHQNDTETSVWPPCKKSAPSCGQGISISTEVSQHSEESLSSKYKTKKFEDKEKEDGGAENDDDSFANDLKCSICCEIFHEPVSLHPCMHTFCSGCYSNWMTTSNRCPACRAKVDKICKNRLVKNLCDTYLKKNPSQRRSEEELNQLNECNKITGDIMTQPGEVEEINLDSDDSSTSPANFSSDENDDGSNSSEMHFRHHFGQNFIHHFGRHFSQNHHSSRHLAGGVTRPTLPAPPPIASITCPQCPCNQVITISSNNSGGSSTYICPAQNARHVTCQCCAQFMPDRRFRVTLSAFGVDSVSSDNQQQVNDEWKKQFCSNCSTPYCMLYYATANCNNNQWSSSATSSCVVCMNHFKDFQFTESEFKSVINGGNRYESWILLDYVKNTKNLSLAEFFTNHILPQLPCVLSSGGSTSSNPDATNQALQLDTILCRQCALRKFGLLCYEYRKRIPNEELAPTVTNRQNCWYGRNCTTQRTRDHHANNFNHICEQTRRN